MLLKVVASNVVVFKCELRQWAKLLITSTLGRVYGNIPHLIASPRNFTQENDTKKEREREGGPYHTIIARKIFPQPFRNIPRVIIIGGRVLKYLYRYFLYKAILNIVTTFLDYILDKTTQNKKYILKCKSKNILLLFMLLLLFYCYFCLRRFNNF